jgi:hypothetical protein
MPSRFIQLYTPRYSLLIILGINGMPSKPPATPSDCPSPNVPNIYTAFLFLSLTASSSRIIMSFLSSPADFNNWHHYQEYRRIKRQYHGQRQRRRQQTWQPMNFAFTHINITTLKERFILKYILCVKEK